MPVLLAAALLVILGVVAFSLQNTAPVTVQFLAWKWQMDAGRLGAFAAITGAIPVTLVLGADSIRLRWRLHQMSRQVSRLETRLMGLEAGVPAQVEAGGEDAPQSPPPAAPGGDAGDDHTGPERSSPRRSTG